MEAFAFCRKTVIIVQSIPRGLVEDSVSYTTGHPRVLSSGLLRALWLILTPSPVLSICLEHRRSKFLSPSRNLFTQMSLDDEDLDDSLFQVRSFHYGKP